MKLLSVLIFLLSLSAMAQQYSVENKLNELAHKLSPVTNELWFATMGNTALKDLAPEILALHWEKAGDQNQTRKLREISLNFGLNSVRAITGKLENSGLGVYKSLKHEINFERVS